MKAGFRTHASIAAALRIAIGANASEPWRVTVGQTTDVLLRIRGTGPLRRVTTRPSER